MTQEEFNEDFIKEFTVEVSPISSRSYISINAQTLGEPEDNNVVMGYNKETGEFAWQTYLKYQPFKELQTEDFVIEQTDHRKWIPCGGKDIKVTLPNTLKTGTLILVQRQDQYKVEFIGSNTNIIGIGTEIAFQYGIVQCTFDGSDWRILGDLLIN